MFDASGVTLSYRNSIIARNSPNDCGGSEESDGYNFLGDSSCSADGELDIFSEVVNLDPRLAPLRNNGGPTKTHELLPPSPETRRRSTTPSATAIARGHRPAGSDRSTGTAATSGPTRWGPWRRRLRVRTLGAWSSPSPALCRKQNPTILGTLGPDRLVGTSGPDIIQGLDARDVILGKGGDDILCGSLGNDLLKGQGGDDWTKGLRGDDTDRGGPGTDKCVRGPGEDEYFSCENVPLKAHRQRCERGPFGALVPFPGWAKCSAHPYPTAIGPGYGPFGLWTPLGWGSTVVTGFHSLGGRALCHVTPAHVVVRAGSSESP